MGLRIVGSRAQVPWPAVVGGMNGLVKGGLALGGLVPVGAETGAQPYTPVRSLGEATLWRVREQGSGRRRGSEGTRRLRICAS